MKLRIDNECRYILNDDGSPFFFLGDTAWELFHRLDKVDAKHYLKERARQGFNVIQAVVLSEFDGLTVPNMYGRFPLEKNTDGVYDPALPDLYGDYSYFDHVDFIVSEARKLDLYIGMLPTWGDKFNKKWGIGPEIFTPENAYVYGKFIGSRYKDCDNIIWILGGDRPLETEAHMAIIDEMARGIKDSGDTHLMTFHPMGPRSSADEMGVCGKDYIDFHAIQSSHDMDGFNSWKQLRDTANVDDGSKPFFDMEPRYEDHPACFDADFGHLWDADDVRMNLYWNIMEGACGNTYGNHCVWSFNKEVAPYFTYHWRDALIHDGAEQVKYGKQLRYSRPYTQFRRADDIVKGNDSGACMARIAAGRGEEYAFIYSPLGLPFTADLSGFEGKGALASWFNPRDGKTESFAAVPLTEVQFVPPSSCRGKGNDWVLIIDAIKWQKDK